MKKYVEKKMVGGVHLQHTNRFINELNSVKPNKEIVAFRYSDEVWMIGKYKGLKLSETPTSYINWVLNNIRLSPTSVSILENYSKF
jgi:hypothetical protein